MDSPFRRAPYALPLGNLLARSIDVYLWIAINVHVLIYEQLKSVMLSYKYTDV